MIRPFLGALAVIVVGAAGLFWVFGSHETVRGYLDTHCTYSGDTSDQSGHKAREYDCPQAPSTTANKLHDAHKPAEQHNTPAGYFLRYSGEMVGVLAAATAVDRARVLLSKERDGYGLFNPYVGGWWGTYGGPAEAFRGGGPGVGK